MGIAPNQQPTRFAIATERPIEVVEGVGGKLGYSEAESEATATMLFKVVRGNWGSAASMAPVRQSFCDGAKSDGCHRPATYECSGEDSLGQKAAATTSPNVKTTRA